MKINKRSLVIVSCIGFFLVGSLNLLMHGYKKTKKKVLTYGTFDLFHYGHQRLFDNMVKLLGKDTEIYVGISSDEFNATKNKKAMDSFEVRSNNVEKHPNIVGTFMEKSWDQKTKDVKRINPDFFIMGSDWAGKFDKLKKFCKVIYLPRTVGISSTMLREIRQKKNR